MVSTGFRHTTPDLQGVIKRRTTDEPVEAGVVLTMTLSLDEVARVKSLLSASLKMDMNEIRRLERINFSQVVGMAGVRSLLTQGFTEHLL